MEFFPTVIIRAPLLPFSTTLNKKEVKRIFKQNAVFNAGVYLASPALYHNLTTEKALLSLGRYYIRSKTRPTPFGLFSGTGPVNWSEKNAIILNKERKALVHLDIQLIQKIQSQIEQGTDPNLLYYPNSSLYKVGTEIRCMKITPSPSLISICSSSEIEEILLLAEGGLSKAKCRKDQVKLFQEMIDHHLLTSSLETPCTGTDPFLPLSAYLKDAENPWRNLNFHLNRLNTKITPLYLKEFSADLPSMDKVPLHVTQYCSTPNGKNTLDREIQKDLRLALHYLQQWSPKQTNETLNDFNRRFQARYAEEEIPLSEALDPEFGLEYIPCTASSELTEDIPNASELNAFSKDEQLENDLLPLLRENPYSLELPERKASNTGLNASFSMVFRLVEGSNIYLEMVGGSSATAILGRFGVSESSTRELLHGIVQAEERWNPEVDFAEVLYLPEGKAANIAFRPTMRKYEIPYLGRSDLPPHQQIKIEDLLISVTNGQLTLRNRLNGRRIIPRIANAHNIRLSSLPIYRFLGDLQFQDFQPSLHFSWLGLEKVRSFLPRVYAGKVIVQPASWRITSPDFALIKTGHIPHCTYPIPRHFVWKNGDHELFVDRENDFSLACLWDAVQSREEIRIFEFLPPDKNVVKSPEGEPFCHQFVASVFQKRTLFTDLKSIHADYNCRRDFCPGSEWVYFKYYCGSKATNRILQELVAPLIQMAIDAKWIDKWFFVRYFDPEPHIRLRLHLKHRTALPVLLVQCEKSVLPFLENRSIWKVQLDTYKREIERYHAQNIEIVESLFCWDSVQCLRKAKDGNHWYWTLRQIKVYLNAAEFTLEQKRHFVRKMSAAFATEYDIDKIQIDKKYRKKRYQIENYLSGKLKAPQVLRHGLLRIKRNSPTLFPDILGSLIHMMVNRSIASDPRTHEYLMYEFLDRYYKSYSARNENF
jgi:thiopeptide-type bacteriocin biosynthesis protein